MVIATIVGAIAFLAGLQFNLGRNPQATIVSATPPASLATADAPSTAASPLVIVRTSLADIFQPGGLITGIPGGLFCVTHATAGAVAPSASSGRIPVRTWLAQCPMKAADQARFRDDLFQELASALNAPRWNATNDEAGLSTAEFPFLDDGVPLTLFVATRAISDNVVVALTLAPTP